MRESSGDLRDARLRELLNLGSLEMGLLWAATAAALDPALGPVIRDVGGGEARQGISLALYAVIARLEPSQAQLLALQLTPLNPLFRYGILQAKGDGVVVARPLAVAERVAAYLAGDDTIDAEVVRSGGGVLTVSAEPVFAPVQLAGVKRIVQALAHRNATCILVEGPPDVGKRLAAATAALALDLSVVQLDLSRIGTSSAELEVALVALRRECLLTGAIPLVARVDELLGVEHRSDGRAATLIRFLEETPIPIIATARSAGLDLGVSKEVFRVEVPAPDVATRIRLWETALNSPGDDVDLNLVASRYRIGAGAINRASSVARMLSGKEPLSTHSIIQGVRNGIAERMGGIAQRIEVKQGWDELVLSHDTLDQVRALIARVRHGHKVHEQWGFGTKLHRGSGTAALFSGPPGTGKTMVAGIIARELELELYQVDLSKVVSKWVGETEKQLSRIFEAAEAGHALLLFDEADSLFAKRTEVKSAVDRYANLEVNYLLQRIETFGGICVLTTNLDTSIDPALRRRLASHIVFDAPDVDERITLWKRMITTDAPVGDLDEGALAEEFPDMTGANIRNAVLAAAFLAASEDGVIKQEHLRRAGRGEYRAMGRVISGGRSK